MSSFFLFCLAILFSVASFAQTPPANQTTNQTTNQADTPAEAVKPAPRYELCELGREVRSLRIKLAPNGVCTAVYTKEGVDQNVGESSEFMTCHRVIERIRKNLTTGGWACRDISTERVSFSN